MASRPHTRPISPHLQIWRWGPAMLISILHRATGDGLAVVGTVLLVWWLAALAGGAEAYATFLDTFTTAAGHLNIVGWVVGVGLTASVFEHALSGVRHLVLDTGAGFELKANRRWSIAAMAAAVALTLVYWLYLGLR